MPIFFFFQMIRRPPRSTLSSSSAASDVYKRQSTQSTWESNIFPQMSKLFPTQQPTSVFTDQFLKLKQKLQKKIKLRGLKIQIKQCSQFLRKLSPFLLNEEALPNIVPDKESFSKRIVLLQKDIDSELSQIPDELSKWIKEENAEVVDYELEQDYTSFSQEQILKEVLPQDIDSKIQQEGIKNIQIIELNSQQLKYKKEIGQIVLEKSGKHISKVMLKVENQCEGEFKGN
eukprot:TRINITY_DN1475_c0_g1_i2.p2 TRINITY_DN1475_c0_g1~~TRINITY_DN1475_c0_g1_i2.p2  ORF type:complete len:230 (-),score=56.84 TRINITY_DN1475_c0_g1_i2:871-1560(-)